MNITIHTDNGPITFNSDDTPVTVQMSKEEQSLIAGWDWQASPAGKFIAAPDSVSEDDLRTLLETDFSDTPPFEVVNGLIYKLKNGINDFEINVNQVNGDRHNEEAKHDLALRIATLLNRGN